MGTDHPRTEDAMQRFVSLAAAALMIFGAVACQNEEEPMDEPMEDGSDDTEDEDGDGDDMDDGEEM